MNRCVWLVVELEQKGEWNCATTTHGVQCVMTSGMLKMLELSADSLDCHFNVSHGTGLNVTYRAVAGNEPDIFYDNTGTCKRAVAPYRGYLAI